MPFKGHSGIGLTHAAAIVNYLHQGFARVINDKFNFCGPGIHRVFQKFFDGAGGSLYYFAGRNLVGNIIG
jgi:hypothetical protein